MNDLVRRSLPSAGILAVLEPPKVFRDNEQLPENEKRYCWQFHIGWLPRILGPKDLRCFVHFVLNVLHPTMTEN